MAHVKHVSDGDVFLGNATHVDRERLMWKQVNLTHRGLWPTNLILSSLPDASVCEAKVACFSGS